MNLSKKLVAAGIAALALFGSTGIAFADAPGAGSGADGLPDLVIGGGSDTTYYAMQKLEGLYNLDPGCAVDTSSSANQGKCLVSQASDVATNGNYDHDIMVSNYPTGSGVGLGALTSTGFQYSSGNIDYARSSRALKAGIEQNELQAWGYARDGIAIVSLGGLTENLSVQQIHDIYTCSITDWHTIDAVLPVGSTITPWGMQTSSGTYATFRDFIRANATVTGGGALDTAFDPNAGGGVTPNCVKQLQIGTPAVATLPFENDTKPLLDPVKNGGVAAAGGIWWGSAGEFNTFAFKRGAGTTILQVGGFLPNSATISANTYPILRTLWHVTRKTDAIDVAPVAPATAHTVGWGTFVSTGVYTANSTANGGKPGAVREFTKFLCKTNLQQATDPFTGVNFRTEVTGALAASGFVQVPSALRTAGLMCTIG